MDLNAIPGDVENFEQQVQEYSEPVERIVSAIDIANRDRDERRKRPRKERRWDDRNKLSLPPPGWLDCPSFGHEIGHYIIPSKVPLGERFNDHIPHGKRYSFKQVIHQQWVLGRTIGLVIDLTNTTRYYKAADLKEEGIEHVKIACAGRDSVPSNAQVNEFVHEVSRFLSSRREYQPKRHVLVHCTHGYNRTGYMIIHFLMRSATMPSISVRKAVQLFAEARPPGIYKPDYITALYEFYHEEKPENFTCPSTPEWKRPSSSVLDPNGKEPLPDEDDDGNLAAPVQDNCEKELRMSNNDVLGDDIPTEQAQCFRAFCYKTFKSSLHRFPGSHPVSLNRENLQLLRQRYYYSTWKADGTRYMMLITVDGCYLIDRSFNFRRLQMRFPCRSTDEGRTGERTHHYTLLDGEMVIDTITTPDSHLKHQERRYLIYDLMAINQVSVVERPFHERWKMIEKEIIEPRNYERWHNIRNNPFYRYDLEPFRVRRKDFWLLSTVAKLLKGFIPKLSHDADGLIFQGWDDPYVPRTHEGLLKWKYPEMNSVDFLFEVGEEEDNRQHLFLYERGKKKLMEAGNRLVVFGDGSDPSLYSGKIIECSWDSDERVWLCMRVRVDKSTPNEFNTYRKVMRSINDNITEDILLSEINEIIRLPMYADRMKQESKQIDLARRK